MVSAIGVPNYPVNLNSLRRHIIIDRDFALNKITRFLVIHTNASINITRTCMI